MQFVERKIMLSCTKKVSIVSDCIHNICTVLTKCLLPYLTPGFENRYFMFIYFQLITLKHFWLALLE